MSNQKGVPPSTVHSVASVAFLALTLAHAGLSALLVCGVDIGIDVAVWAYLSIAGAGLLVAGVGGAALMSAWRDEE